MTEACRDGGMDHTSFYACKKCFTEHGFEGLNDCYFSLNRNKAVGIDNVDWAESQNYV